MSEEVEEKKDDPEKNKKRTCFIITPVGENDSEIRRHIDGVIKEVILPVLDQLDFEKSDPIYETCISGSLVKTIIKSVYESDLVIANLTTQNPNVMYEVALRHAAAKPIIHITSELNNLPFDINSYNTIEYKDDMLGAIDLKDKLIKSIKHIDFDNPKISNPIIDNIEETVITGVPKEEVSYANVLYELTGSIKHLNMKIDRLSVEKSRKITKNDISSCSNEMRGEIYLIEILLDAFGLEPDNTDNFISGLMDIFTMNTKFTLNGARVNIELPNGVKINKEVLSKKIYDVARKYNINIFSIKWYS